MTEAEEQVRRAIDQVLGASAHAAEAVRNVGLLTPSAFIEWAGGAVALIGLALESLDMGPREPLAVYCACLDRARHALIDELSLNRDRVNELTAKAMQAASQRGAEDDKTVTMLSVGHLARALENWWGLADPRDERAVFGLVREVAQAEGHGIGVLANTPQLPADRD